MKYVLDSDTISMLMRGDQEVMDSFFERSVHPNAEIMTTVFSHSEIWYGYYLAKLKHRKLPDPDKILERTKLLPFTKEASDCYAMIKAKLTIDGNLIQDIDLFIASIAMTNNTILVSNNTRHFSRIEGLKLENWKKARR